MCKRAQKRSVTPLHHHLRPCLGHSPTRRNARRSGCLTTFGLSSPAQPALPPGELRYKGRKGLAINCMRMGDGSRSGHNWDLSSLRPLAEKKNRTHKKGSSLQRSGGKAGATVTLPHPWIWSYLRQSFPGASHRAQKSRGPSPRAAPRGERRLLPTPTLVMPHN